MRVPGERYELHLARGCGCGGGGAAGTGSAGGSKPGVASEGYYHTGSKPAAPTWEGPTRRAATTPPTRPKQ